MAEIALIVIAWLMFFASHSLLATMSVKTWIYSRMPGVGQYYRLLYNAAALLFLAPPLYLTRIYSGETLWAWPGLWHYVADSLTLLAGLGFAWSLRYYDLSIFLGYRQWLENRCNPNEPGPLCISPLHRYVRHPWYSLGLILVWTRDFDSAWLASAILITAYFVVGSRLEERKLSLQYGETYIRYKNRIPAFIPRFSRSLSAVEAEEHMRDAQRSDDRF